MFLDDFNEAQAIKEKRRKVLPGIYNPAKINQKPVPLLAILPSDRARQTTDVSSQSVPNSAPSTSNLVSNNQSDVTTDLMPNNEQQDFDGETNEQVPTNESFAGDLIDFHSENENENDLVSNDDDNEENNSNGVTDEQEPPNEPSTGDLINVQSDVNDDSLQNAYVAGVQNIQLDQSNYYMDGSAIYDVVDETTDVHPVDHQVNDSFSNGVVTMEMLSSALNEVMNASLYKPEPEFPDLDVQNSQAVEGVFNESFEDCDESGDVLILKKNAIPRPINDRNPYEVKANDIVSGNMPFASNVR